MFFWTCAIIEESILQTTLTHQKLQVPQPSIWVLFDIFKTATYFLSLTVHPIFSKGEKDFYFGSLRKVHCVSQLCSTQWSCLKDHQPTCCTQHTSMQPTTNSTRRHRKVKCHNTESTSSLQLSRMHLPCSDTPCCSHSKEKEGVQYWKQQDFGRST